MQTRAIVTFFLLSAEVHDQTYLRDEATTSEVETSDTETEPYPSSEDEGEEL